MPKAEKNNYSITEGFSEREFDQTDFGHIYFNQPEITEHPRTVEQLARVLRYYNKLGKRVTIRNTGHSVNGQTLTSGVQINVGSIDHVRFNRQKMVVTAGCGASWDKVLRIVGLPKYCLPVFPNNPNQEIHIGGTASVGGVGPYSIRQGGLWNHVASLKLVSMEGEIIECSLDKHPDVFKYALGGFGRIGVIAELTLNILNSSKNILGLLLTYNNKNHYLGDLGVMALDPVVDGLFAAELFKNADILSRIGLHENAIMLFLEGRDTKELKDKADQVKKYYHKRLAFFLETPSKAYEGTWDLGLNYKRLLKKDFVYWYPKSRGEDQLNLSHPWSDFVLSRDKYPIFAKEVMRVVYKYDIQRYIVRESFLHNLLDLAVFPLLVLKKLRESRENFFPLSLDLPSEKSSYVCGIFPNVPAQKMQDAVKVTRMLTDLVYDLGGKRYIYGFHNLTKKQVEKQYGNSTIRQWQKIKDKLDPKHLLNIGVIEHLDD